MKSNKYLILLCSAVFLLGIAGIASALPLKLYDVEINKWEYVPGDTEFSFKVEGKSATPDGWDNSDYLKWEFKISDDGSSYEFKSSARRSSFKGEGELLKTVFKDLGSGNYSFEAMFDTDKRLSTLSNGDELFVLGSFTKNSASSNEDILINTNVAAPLTEPGTLLLVGDGLVGFAAIGRKGVVK